MSVKLFCRERKTGGMKLVKKKPRRRHTDVSRHACRHMYCMVQHKKSPHMKPQFHFSSWKESFPERRYRIGGVVTSICHLCSDSDLLVEALFLTVGVSERCAATLSSAALI